MTAEQDGTSFDGHLPLSTSQLQRITFYLDRELQVNAAHGNSLQPNNEGLKPPTAEQLTGLFRYMDDYHWRTAKSSISPTDDWYVTAETKRPNLLCISNNNGPVGVAAARFDLCSQVVGIDVHQQRVLDSKRLAFEQGVLERCHFFEVDSLDVDPKLLLNNPHFMADKVNNADVVFIHASQEKLRSSIPLLSLLSEKRKGRKFVTLVNHVPEAFVTENPLQLKHISEADIAVYDGIILDSREDRTKLTAAHKIVQPPEPLDGDEIDKEFARDSIRYALPERL